MEPEYLWFWPAESSDGNGPLWLRSIIGSGDDGGAYAANSGFGGAANDPNKSEGTHEAVHEIGSVIGGNTLVSHRFGDGGTER